MTSTTDIEITAGTTSRSEIVGSLAVVISAAFWGTSGLFVKYIVASVKVSAMALAFWRDLTTFLILFAALALFQPSSLRVRKRDVRWLAAMGASLGAFHVLWNLGVLLNGAAVATVQQAAMPALVAIVALLVWNEKLTWTKIVAILLTFVGTVLVSGLDALGESRLSVNGFLAGMGIPITYAAWTLFGKRARADYSPFTTLTYAFAFGALVLLPFQFFIPQPWPITGRAVLWFAGLIAMATIISFSVYTFALGLIEASVAGILAMSEIGFVAIYAYFLLGERLTTSQILGAGLVLAGVMVLSWKRRQRVSAGE